MQHQDLHSPQRKCSYIQFTSGNGHSKGAKELKRMSHSPCSPDLVPGNYFIFPKATEELYRKFQNPKVAVADTQESWRPVIRLC